MLHPDFTPQHRRLGQYASWSVFLVGVLYTLILILGLLSLETPQDPIGDPYFSLMELLIVIIAPLMVVAMVAVHGYAAKNDKVYSLTALSFMLLLAGITCSVHFVVLTVRSHIEVIDPEWSPLLLSFTWPSVAYAVDIFAWDVFFALAVLFVAPVFKVGRMETTVRVLMIISGVLSLAGLIGVALGDMQVRLIGVVGYAGVAPVAFLFLAMVFGRTQQVSGET